MYKRLDCGDEASTGLNGHRRTRLWVLVLAAATSSGLFARAQDSAQPATAGSQTAVPAGASAPVPAGAAAVQAADPPSRVLRLGVMDGEVSVEPASVNTFAAAELNEVLTTGDRIYTDPGAVAELQGGQTAVRLGGGTDLTVTAMTDALAQFGLAAGAVHLRSYALLPGAVLEIDTAEAAVTVLQPGDVRIEEDPDDHSTVVDLVAGSVQVDAPEISQVLTPGQRLRVNAGDPESGQVPSLEPLAAATPDALDSFNNSQDSSYASNADAEGPYVNPDTVGYADLANSGSWDTSDYGPVWYPAVAVDWIPYHYGHWRWCAPWGWTWVESEPWGFAPFHYGRWVEWRGRWGWIPGPPVLRPVYAPALVSFAGGTQYAASIGYAPGFGITAWFPLGPREAYAPWYHGSTLYLNRVNASNIYDANTAEARAFYNQRAVNVFGGASLASRTFANRLAATTAMPQSSFAAGRSAVNGSLRIPAETLAAAPVLPHPLVSPEPSILTPKAAQALPPVQARPAPASVASQAGAQPTGGVLFFHRANSPTPAPNFEQQREAMQGSDPGRPLSSTQMENLRQNRPAGPPAGRESAPHPPAARAAPATAKGSSSAPAASKH